MISIDGLMPDSYLSGAWKTPTLKSLAAVGAYAEGVAGVFPTVTYPAHTTLITGVPPSIHGIYANRVFDPEGTVHGAWYWYARDIATPTLISAAHAKGLRTAVIGWPVTVGSDATVLLPEFWAGDAPQQLKLLRTLGRPAELIANVEAAEGHAVTRPYTDAARTEIAIWSLRAYEPDLMLLHLLDTDATQHGSGPGSPDAHEAVESADQRVEAVLHALDAAGLRDRTDVVVVSDHGFLPIKHSLQLNAAFKERGWFRTDDAGRVVDWQAYFQSSGGSGFVFLKDPGDFALMREVKALLNEVADDPRMGIDRVLDRDAIAALGGDPRASFAIDMKPGAYTEEGTSGLLVRASLRGGHGYSPERKALDASLIMIGPDVHVKGSLGRVQMTAIAPTIASWLHLELSPQASQSLAGESLNATSQ
jgi:predicted AlkP superfamily pyrophosphatase or phosphodiesterase